MIELIRPMRAAKYNPDKQRFPCWGSVKIDGVRCLIRSGVALSRKLKPIPNQFIQSWAFKYRLDLEGCDGELGVGSMSASDFFRVTTSGVMSHEGTPDFTFYCFDVWDTRSVYRHRYLDYTLIKDIPRVIAIHYRTLGDSSEVAMWLAEMEKDGHEGVMLRDPNTRYKMGQATPNTQELIKVKTMDSDEAVVIGFEEQMHNANEATISETGRTKRSSHKKNMIPKGTLGALIVRRSDGVEFNIGTGFDDELRNSIWKFREGLIGTEVTYRFFPQGGKNKPRFPVFVGFRHD